MGPNQKLLREAYERFAAGDAEHLYRILADYVVWKSTGDRNDMPFAGEWHGHDGVRAYFNASRSHWEVPVHIAREFFTDGDKRFAIRVDVEAINARTKKRVQFHKVDLVTMQYRKVTTYEELFDSAALVKAS